MTILRLANRGEGFKMHAIEGRAEPLKDFHEIDCPAYAGAVIRFDGKDVASFQQEVMSQHYAIVPGRHAAALREFCRLTNIHCV